jgi:hypothetical protein
MAKVKRPTSKAILFQKRLATLGMDIGQVSESYLEIALD